MSEFSVSPAEPSAEGWDCHVHVFDAAQPAQPGHYLPGHCPLSAIEAHAQSMGVGHLVLVQPSVYGHDNSVMLQALLAAKGRHRGVAVVDAGLDALSLDREFARLHAAGVRGIRFNRVSPAGHSGDVVADLMRLAPRLREWGWHVQWYVRAQTLPLVVGWQAQTGLRFVLDHMAGLGADVPPNDPAWAAMQALADSGAWVKLSAWYRLGAEAPYTALHAHVEQLAQHFESRMIWGSDWPHTSFATGHAPDYASMLAPARDVLGEARWNVVWRQSPWQLYA